ncbi:MAG: hypothetical protein V3T77_06295 [Planctomycetota bacterium]
MTFGTLSPLGRMMAPLGWILVSALFLHPAEALAQEWLPKKASEEPPPKDPGDAVECFFLEKLREAEQLFKNGHYRSAFKIADAIQVLAPDISFHKKVKKLRRDAEGRFLGGSILSIRFEVKGAEELEFPVRTLHGQVVIENVTHEEIQLKLSRRQTLFGQAHYRVTEIYEDGSQKISQGTPVVRVEKGFQLAPGEQHSLPLEVFLPGDPTHNPVLQVVTVRGTLRPSAVQLPDRSISRAIPWQTSVTVLLPPELAEVREQPYRQLQLAMLTGDHRQLTAAGWLLLDELRGGGAWAGGQREQTVEMLLKALDRDNPWFQRAAIHLLEAYTGKRRAPTVESWKIWALEKSAALGKK